MIKKLVSYSLLLCLLCAPAFAYRGKGYKSINGARDVATDTSAFNGNLSTADTTVQAALDTLDNMTAGSGAPSDATYITQTANGTLSAEQALSSLSTGIMRVATTTGVVTSLTDSAGIAANISDETGSGALVFGTSPTFTTPALGTPSAVNLTNGTALPVSGITASTVTALGVGSVELGHATDTTLSRSSAGVLAVEGVVIPSVSSTDTLTNKRITPRVGTVTDAATITPTGDSSDVYTVTALAQAATIAAPSGTPTNGQRLIIRFLDNGTGRALTWNAIYRAIGITLPTTTTASKTLYVGFIYNSADSKWDGVATVVQA